MYYIIQHKTKYTTKFVTAASGEPGAITSKAIWCSHMDGAKRFTTFAQAAHFKNDYYCSRRATIEVYHSPLNQPII